MKKTTLALLTTLLLSTEVYAACRIQWVDHDYNSMTPPIKKQICDSTMDLPAINDPGLRPLQQPKLKPLEPVGLPPLGTTQCRTQQVYENGRWVEKRLCQ